MSIVQGTWIYSDTGLIPSTSALLYLRDTPTDSPLLGVVVVQGAKNVREEHVKQVLGHNGAVEPYPIDEDRFYQDDGFLFGLVSHLFE